MVADWRAIFSAMALAGLVVGFWVCSLPETLTEDAQQNIDLTTIIANMKEAVTKESIGYVLKRFSLWVTFGS